ncbi:response regulator transcription factor [bacterium]|nr:response regulator transcription factor [bacterium]
MSKRIVLCVDDIMFTSKIAVTAKALNIEITSVTGNPEEAAGRIRSLNPSAVLIDLNSKKINPIALIHVLKSDPAAVCFPIIGFLSHVDIDTRAAAVKAGCDQVLPRSVFVQQLPEILSAI